MKFIPDYRVCYKGAFYEAGKEFDIDPADAEEMSEHGEIVDDDTPPIEPPDTPVKRGRPKKSD